jgi:hypothetical protein
VRSVGQAKLGGPATGGWGDRGTPLRLSTDPLSTPYGSMTYAVLYGTQSEQTSNRAKCSRMRYIAQWDYKCSLNAVQSMAYTRLSQNSILGQGSRPTIEGEQKAACPRDT